MAEILSKISLISYIAAGISFFLAVVFWFVFKIPTVAGDLSGKNARKALEEMRKSRSSAGRSTYHSEAVRNPVSGLKSEPVRTTGGDMEKRGVETGILEENKAAYHRSEDTGLLEEDVTGLLFEEEGTALLHSNDTYRTAVPLKLLEEIVLIHTDEVIA